MSSYQQSNMSSYQQSNSKISLIVKVKQGTLQGKVNKSIMTGNIFCSFQGIPYAQPPIGDLRFQDPQPPLSWNIMYNATEEKYHCLQNTITNIGITGSENCLYLNVNTPQPPPFIKTPLPVMVYIHGGAFLSGSGSEATYGSDFLIEQSGLITVTFNYRMNVLGFLNLGLPGCPGNAGLKDQLAALKWVKENIASFGGDPENITIFGEGTGAASVHFHIISPLSRGIFQKAIMQSGTSFVPWALNHKPIKLAMALGKKLGYAGHSCQELLDYLKKQDAADIVLRTTEVLKDLMFIYPTRVSVFPFLPSVEAIKEGAFLPDLPENLIKNATPLPIVIGATNKNGLLVFAMNYKYALESMKNDFSIVLRNNFQIDPQKIPEYAQKIQNYYFGDKEVDENTVSEAADLFTDIFYYRFYEAIEYITNPSCPAYIYEFAFEGNCNINKKLIQFDCLDVPPKGACHADELPYLFYPRVVTKFLPYSTLFVNYKENEINITRQMTTYWANFAKFGNPSPMWKPSTSENPAYLRIDKDSELISDTIFGARLRFLKETLGPVAKPFNFF